MNACLALFRRGFVLSLLTTILLAALPQSAWAQAKDVRGRVTERDGSPMIGVTVQVKNTPVGTVTNTDGNYTIRAGKDDVLIFSYIGMISQEITVGDRTTINVVLKENVEELSELVVVGYGTQKKAHLTGSVSTISSKELNKVPVSNATQLLVGKAPGISGVQSTGGPGSDGTELYVRGFNTFNGSSSPLVLVDGVARPLREVNPRDIESISVLRDAAAAAVYGMRAGNGVILITTKRGAQGRDNISYAGTVTFSTPTTLPKFLNGLEYMQWYNKARELDGKDPQFTPEDMEKVNNGDPTDGFEDTDWLAPALKPTLMQKHTLAVTGGTDRLRYYASGEFLNQNGFLKTHKFNQYGFRANIDSEPVKGLTFSLNLAGRLRNNHTNGTFNWTNQQPGNVWAVLMYGLPFIPREYKGYPTYPFRFEVNPFYGIGHSGYTDNSNYTFEGSTRLQWEVPYVDGLKVAMFASWDYNSLNGKSFNYAYQGMWYDFYPKEYKLRDALYLRKDGSMYRSNTRNTSYILRPSIEYNNTFGDHSVGALFLYEENGMSTENFNARRNGYDLFDIQELDRGKHIPQAGENYPGNRGSSNRIANAGYVGRLNYGYQDKYLAEFSFRYDGTYLFAKDYRWGFFPSGSLAWVISKEDFMQDYADTVNNLKLRASVGQLGRNTVAPYLFLKSYEMQSHNVAFGKDPIAQNTLVTAIKNGMPMPDLTWEKTRTYNLGLDVTLWNGLLGIEADVFYKYTYDILQNLGGNYPPSLGKNYPSIENSGTFDNRGFELVLSHRNTVGDLTYSLSGNMSFSRNRILKMAEPDNILPWQSSIGRSLGRIMGFKTDGLFQTQEEIDNAAIQPSKPRLGEIKYLDIDGDGRVTREKDKVEIARTKFPELVYAINGDLAWRGIDFSFMFQGAALYTQTIQGVWFNGAEDMTPMTSPFYAQRDNPPKYLVEGSWRPDHTDARYPRLTIDRTGANHGFISEHWLIKGSYLRLKNITLGYTLPESLLSHVGMKNLRLYLAGVNLLTFSPFKYIDPEAPNVLQAYYPQQKSISLGLEVAF